MKCGAGCGRREDGASRAVFDAAQQWVGSCRPAITSYGKSQQTSIVFHRSPRRNGRLRRLACPSCVTLPVSIIQRFFHRAKIVPCFSRLRVGPMYPLMLDRQHLGGFLVRIRFAPGIAAGRFPCRRAQGWTTVAALTPMKVKGSSPEFGMAIAVISKARSISTRVRSRIRRCKTDWAQNLPTAVGSARQAEI